MAITILGPHAERYTHYVIPRQSGIEERDRRAYPLPPCPRVAVLTAVIAELRDQGHAVTVTWRRERLADWDATRAANEHSYCADDGWMPNPKGPTLLRFVPGGWDGRVTCDGRETRLMPEHLRMTRAHLRLTIAGHP